MLYVKMLRNTLRRFVKDERGASAIEYALIAAMVAIALVTFVPEINAAVSGIFEQIRDALQGTES
ncbi:Flp family type IVb pilin [Methylonatrum kenyense]|uniref:Flp family type IVb pilin n=1 Tax=Methylonatrum kenyense TaxID=455253 RepID=UPI0020BF3DD4|nr:Flp family type IVb pilin [Methylonatrum kenyense]MCK8515214.1 Flp family type IVb pilin [Methylonatrum kenyense]